MASVPLTARRSSQPEEELRSVHNIEKRDARNQRTAAFPYRAWDASGHMYLVKKEGRPRVGERRPGWYAHGQSQPEDLIYGRTLRALSRALEAHRMPAKKEA
jgi:hypothetical protein